MRVLIATHASLEVDSGEERSLEDLGRELLARGHEVRIANYEGLLDNSSRRPLDEIRGELRSAPIISIPKMPLIGPFAAIPSPRGLRALAEAMRWADVVVFGQFYGFDAVLYLLQRAVRKPVVCSQANALSRPFRTTVRDAVQEGYERTVGRFLLRRFEGVRVCNAEDLRSLSAAGCPRVLLLFPLNIDLASSAASGEATEAGRAWTARLDAEPRLKLLVAGRMTHQKGLDLLAEAIARLGESHPEVLRGAVFLFAGTSELPSALSGVAERFPGRLVNLGVLPREVFPVVLRHVDAVLMPSRYESFGRVAAEAQSLGRPVVATDVTGVRQLVIDGATGIVVRRWDGEELARAILRLFEIHSRDPSRWAEMGTGARSNFVAQFGAERTREQVDALVAALDSLARGP